MKKYTLSILLIFSICFAKPVKSQVVTDQLQTIPQNQLKLDGFVGEKTDLIIEHRVKAQDYDYLVEPFRHKTETRMWQSEFWGKWMLGAVASWEYTHDPELMEMMDQAVINLLETQLPDGYIGNYPPEYQLTNWDIWGRKYSMLGLLRYHDITGNNKALKAARNVADHVITQLGPGNTNIIETGNYHGMASSSILEPVILLYNKTQKEKYLEFAKYIVQQWETPDGPQLINKAIEEVDVASRFPHPERWFSPENGQKAYEMMSCYDGLLELYRVTGEPDYLKAVEMTVENILEEEINIAGSGTSFECWYHGKGKQTLPTFHIMETCVMTTWLKLNLSLLRLTGKSGYADNIELTYYNALLASTKQDGSEIAMYSPLLGHRGPGEKQCNMDINCCSANGPRGYSMMPRFAVMTDPDGIYLNMYSESTATATLTGNNEVQLEQNTEYPVHGLVSINIDPVKEETFTIALRIPNWSEQTSIKVNGENIDGIDPGTYKRITRTWKKGDKIELQLDMRGRLVRQDNHVAIVRGPIVLARDSRFGDGSVDEAAVIQHEDGYVELNKSGKKPAEVWMAFTAPLKLGTGTKATLNPPAQIHFCDFCSAGNTWDRSTRYRVWLPEPLDVRLAPVH
ncbi:MAG: glycoside hydrolase family 127 protein [Bacteroidales bacterium]|nr:glycoside hydrolase family 127 protein [Bacteroidales bacterium]